MRFSFYLYRRAQLSKANNTLLACLFCWVYLSHMFDQIAMNIIYPSIREQPEAELFCTLYACSLILTITSERLDMHAFKDDIYCHVAAWDADVKQDELKEQGTLQWKAARRLRFAASNYGQIRKTIKNCYIHHLQGTLLQPTDSDKNPRLKESRLSSVTLWKCFHGLSW